MFQLGDIHNSSETHESDNFRNRFPFIGFLSFNMKSPVPIFAQHFICMQFLVKWFIKFDDTLIPNKTKTCQPSLTDANSLELILKPMFSRNVTWTQLQKLAKKFLLILSKICFCNVQGIEFPPALGLTYMYISCALSCQSTVRVSIRCIIRLSLMCKKCPKKSFYHFRLGVIIVSILKSLVYYTQNFRVAIIAPISEQILCQQKCQTLSFI